MLIFADSPNAINKASKAKPTNGHKHTCLRVRYLKPLEQTGHFVSQMLYHPAI